jgi:hypothetical protein
MPGRTAAAPPGDVGADPDCRRPRSGPAQRRPVTGAADSDYMPGRTAAAPTGDVGADPEFWPARSGSASLALWTGSLAGLAVTAPGLTRGSRQLRQFGVAGPRRPYPRSRGRGLAPSLRSARTRQAPGLTWFLTGRIFAAFHPDAGLGLYRRAGLRASRRSWRTRRCLVICDVGSSPSDLMALGDRTSP